jgi:hypothetical protein
MGWLERKLSGQEFWDNVDKAKPLIKQRADQSLSRLGYEPSKLSFAVFLGGNGEEVWRVKYWSNPPKDYIDQVARHADLEVYLNNRGEIKRVVTYKEGQEQLLYGKDERIHNGMSQDQVRERLGEPDHIGPPPRWGRNMSDEEWRYNKNSNRTMRIEILFKDKKVVSVAYFG